MDPDVDEGVDDGAQVELPVDQQERRVVGVEAHVHHDLGHVDGPSLDEHAAAEDGAHRRRTAVRVDELEVVARRSLVDRGQRKLPIVLLGQV